MTAVPFVHPWGNRLERWEYRVGRREVDLRGLDLPTDPNGLRCTATCAARRSTSCAPRPARRGARLVARLDYGARPDLLRAFPFPHVVTIDARLDERGLRLTTEIEPTGRAAVPSRSAGTRTCRCPERRAATGSCAGRAASGCSSTNA